MPCNYGQTDTMLTVKDGKNLVPACVIYAAKALIFDCKTIDIQTQSPGNRSSVSRTLYLILP